LRAITRTGGGSQRSSVSWMMPRLSMLKPESAASCRHESGAAASASEFSML
jgi:hypothetical protein